MYGDMKETIFDVQCNHRIIKLILSISFLLNFGAEQWPFRTLRSVINLNLLPFWYTRYGRDTEWPIWAFGYIAPLRQGIDFFCNKA